jgi:two-component system response regulator MprA
MAPNVLVVDDDPAIREALELALAFHGYEAAGALDGLDALDKVTAEPPAVILLDLDMPRMDGPSFARALAARGLRPRVPLLVLSGGEFAAEAAGELGAEAYTAKPIELRGLLQKVAYLAGEETALQ